MYMRAECVGLFDSGSWEGIVAAVVDGVGWMASVEWVLEICSLGSSSRESSRMYRM
jgi:hypothetical protein